MNTIDKTIRCSYSLEYSSYASISEGKLIICDEYVTPYLHNPNYRPKEIELVLSNTPFLDSTSVIIKREFRWMVIENKRPPLSTYKALTEIIDEIFPNNQSGETQTLHYKVIPL